MLLHYEPLYVMPIKHRKLKHWEREGQRDWQRMKEFWLIMFPNWQTGDINLPLCEILLYEVPMCTRIFTNQLKFQPLMINEPAHMNYRAGILIHPALYTSRPLLCVQISVT